CFSIAERRSTYECVRCLKAFMNNTYGLKKILGHEEALTIMSRTIDPADPPTMLEAVRLLAAICLVPPNGHDKALEGITVCGEIRSQERFLPIISGLSMRDNPAMQVACIQLVNAIVSAPDDLDFRMHLRNEFMRTGLIDLLGWLDQQEDEEVKTHLNIFHGHKEDDQEEFSHRYDNIRLFSSLTLSKDPRACFELLLNAVSNTIAEPYFVSILQHLLSIRDDMNARPQYYKLIEECITQIVLHRSGCDPDFRHTKRFDIDVEPLLSDLSDRSKFEDTGGDLSIADISNKLDNALTAKQESEAKAMSLENKVQQYELELTQLKEKKKKYSTSTQTKRLNWNKLNPKQLEKDSLWVKLNEAEFESPDIFSNLETMFSTKAPPVKEQTDTGERKPAKKGKELKVLDMKSGQNLSILLGSIKIPYEEIRRRILAVDEDNLTAGMLEQLIKYMPEPEEIKRLSELKDEYSDLAEPEQFAVTMSSIKRLGPRLNTMLFKMRFPELVSDIKPDLVAATEACDEVRNSQRFAKLLELLLLMGNYLNTGSRNAQSVGFDISFLTKLENTKSQDGSTTMLHFLAQVLEEKYPDILGFIEETIHIDKAARVSAETLQKNVANMGKQLKQLETDLKGNKAFLKEARAQHELLEAMHLKLEKLFLALAKYFAFDPKKYSMEDLFGDLKTFKDGLQKALKENAKKRETQEKIKRAREAKEKAEREKKEKKLRQAAILDMTTDDNQEGVMDNLLEALKTGSAFNVNREKRDGKRRTPRAAGGGKGGAQRAGLPA
ncbi:hypothetical protein EGW08_004969, partial [Elysia chlorotica]